MRCSIQLKEMMEVLENIKFFLFGLVAFLCILVYLIATLPILLYRWVVCSVLSPFYPEHIVEPVNLSSTLFATEFLESKSNLPPRSAVVVDVTIEGTVSKESITSAVNSRWIRAINSKGQLKHPELQQYIVKWMGFMFWKKDSNFSLNKHIYFHTIAQASSFSECEQYKKTMMEELLNNPYPRNKSPWELHVIHNYKSEELLKRTKESFSTLLILKAHHTYLDGVSLQKLFAEELFQKPLVKSTRPQGSHSMSLNKVLQNLALPLKMFRDLGFMVYPAIVNEQSPFYRTDGGTTDRQIFERSPLISIEKIKAIRQKFGVRSTSIFIAGMVAATRNFVKEKGWPWEYPKINMGYMYPLPNHPDRLTNHISVALFNIDTNPNYDPVSRLKICNNEVVQAGSSTIPLLILPFFHKMISYTFPFLVSRMVLVKLASTGLSNFPVTNSKLSFNGRAVPTVQGVVGCGPGSSGLGCQAIGYDDFVQVVLVSKNVLNRPQLHKYMERMCEEIDRLYELAINEESDNTEFS